MSIYQNRVNIIFVFILASCAQIQPIHKKQELPKVQVKRDTTFVKDQCVKENAKLETLKATDWESIADCYLTTQNLPKAYISYTLGNQQVESGNPIRDRMEIKKASVVYSLGHREEALKSLKEIKPADSVQNIYYLTMAKISLDMNHLEEARKYLNFVHSTDPSKKILEAHYFALIGSYQKSLSLFQQVGEAELYKNNILENYLDILVQMGKDSQARSIASKYKIHFETSLGRGQ